MTGPCEPAFTVESSLTQDRFSLALTTAWDDTVVIVQIAVFYEVASAVSFMRRAIWLLG